LGQFKRAGHTVVREAESRGRCTKVEHRAGAGDAGRGLRCDQGGAILYPSDRSTRRTGPAIGAISPDEHAELVETYQRFQAALGQAIAAGDERIEAVDATVQIEAAAHEAALVGSLFGPDVVTCGDNE